MELVTVEIEADAWERLERARGENETVSDVIRREVPNPGIRGSGVPPEGRGTILVPLSAEQDRDGPGTLGQDARATTADAVREQPERTGHRILERLRTNDWRLTPEEAEEIRSQRRYAE